MGGEGDDDTDIGVFDEPGPLSGWKPEIGAVWLWGADTLRVYLNLRLEVAEG